MRPIRAGSLRHLVVLQAENTKDDGHGGQALAPWVDVGEPFYCSIEPLSGNEAVVARQLQDTITHKVILRYRPGVQARMRIKFGSRVFNIVEPPRNHDERNRLLELRCEEGAGV